MRYSSQRMIMYPHLNSSGMLYAGQTLSWIDEESIIFATQELQTTKLATVKVGEVEFKNLQK